MLLLCSAFYTSTFISSVNAVYFIYRGNEAPWLTYHPLPYLRVRKGNEVKMLKIFRIKVSVAIDLRKLENEIGKNELNSIRKFCPIYFIIGLYWGNLEKEN